MKKLLIISLFIILSFICGAIILFVSTSTNMNKFYKTECIEDGNCKEGITINIGSKEITVNEKTCAENKGTWDNKTKICRF